MLMLLGIWTDECTCSKKVLAPDTENFMDELLQNLLQRVLVDPAMVEDSLLPELLELAHAGRDTERIAGVFNNFPMNVPGGVRYERTDPQQVLGSTGQDTAITWANLRADIDAVCAELEIDVPRLHTMHLQGRYKHWQILLDDCVLIYVRLRIAYRYPRNILTS